MKIAIDGRHASGIEDKHEGKPHGWIQWKGTDVCMDIHCKCGNLSHIDSDFCYEVKCPYCNQGYSCNGHIELIPIVTQSENIKIAEL